MKSTNTPVRSNPMAFEELEGRKLFSAALSAGLLAVNGSAGNDQIQIYKSYGPTFTNVTVRENGVTTGSFSVGTVMCISVYGNDGNDTIAIGSDIDCRATVEGGAGDDTLYSGSGNDIIRGGDGNDYANGGSGNDFIDGGSGDDSIDGYTGNDSLLGGDGDDTLTGFHGADQLFGQGGSDHLRGDDDNDRLFGGDGTDYLFGGFGDDSLYGDAGTDILHGDDGSDYLTGGSGIDSLDGGDGNDVFHTQDNELDYIHGGAGWDTAVVDNKVWWEPGSAQDDWVDVESVTSPKLVASADISK